MTEDTGLISMNNIDERYLGLFPPIGPILVSKFKFARSFAQPILDFT